MTEIKLHTYGEKLIVSEKTTLASGDIGSAVLIVVFDDAWDSYTNKSAIFTTKEHPEGIEALMINDTASDTAHCTIPAEALQKAGTLGIGIRGIANDGETVLTSSVAKYNIVQGASSGMTTLEPTMDLYQQYLAAMDSKTAPLFNAYKAAMDADYAEKTKALEDDYTAYKTDLLESMTGTVLWENPNPDEIMKEVTIPLDLSQYVWFLVELRRHSTADTYITVTCTRKNTLYYASGASESTEFSLTDDGITIVAADNGYYSPVLAKVIGYKHY